MIDRLRGIGGERMTARRRHALVLAAFGLAYLLGAASSQALMLSPHLGTAVWPPGGLFVAALARTPATRWRSFVAVGIVADALCGSAIYGFPLAVSLAIAAGNALEAVCGAWLLSRGRGDFALDDESAVLRLASLSAFCSTLLSTFLGGTAVALHLGQSLFDVWALWWTGDATGVLMFAPMLLLHRRPGGLRHQTAQVAAMAAATLVGGHLLLVSGYPVLFLYGPLIIWAAMRAEFIGVIVVSALLTGQTLLYTRAQLGALHGVPGDELRQFLVQLFLMTMSVTGLVLAGLFQRRRVALGRLREVHDHAERLVEERTAELALRELQLQALNERLQAADAAKDRFLAVLAHEVRSPLMTLHTGLAVLGKQPPPDVRERVQASMSRQTALLRSLMDDLLDLARIREGKLHLDMRPVDIGSVVATAVEAARPEVERRRHALQVTVPDAAAVVQGDFTRLVQAVLNLLFNACRYTDEGGRIELVAALAGPTVEIGISDNGIGIDPARIRTLFELHPADTGEHRGGLGIGLPLVKRIVELHGGTVHARSDGPGRGSRFTVSLPCRPA